jgi:hypothetical protein
LKAEGLRESTDNAVIFLPRANIEIVVYKPKWESAIERASTAIAKAGYELTVVGRKQDVMLLLESDSFQLRYRGIQMKAVRVRTK